MLGKASISFMTNYEICPHCGQKIRGERQIALYSGLIFTLKKVYQWCEKTGRHEFERKDIKGLFIRNENDTARFGDLVMFGGLVYKKGKAHYGLNMERCRDFFRDEYEIPTIIWKKGAVIRKENYKKLSQIPALLELLDREGNYKVEYSRQLF